MHDAALIAMRYVRLWESEMSKRNKKDGIYQCLGIIEASYMHIVNLSGPLIYVSEMEIGEKRKST